jgi:hypothetical protein
MLSGVSLNAHPTSVLSILCIVEWHDLASDMWSAPSAVIHHASDVMKAMYAFSEQSAQGDAEAERTREGGKVQDACNNIRALAADVSLLLMIKLVLGQDLFYACVKCDKCVLILP